MPRPDELITVIDGHEMDIHVLDVEEESLNSPKAACTYDDGSDVTLTIGKNVVVKMNIAETVNLMADLQIAIDAYTNRIEVFNKH